MLLLLSDTDDGGSLTTVLIIACCFFGMLLVLSIAGYIYLRLKMGPHLQRLPSDHHELTLQGPIIEVVCNVFIIINLLHKFNLEIHFFFRRKTMAAINQMNILERTSIKDSTNYWIKLCQKKNLLETK